MPAVRTTPESLLQAPTTTLEGILPGIRTDSREWHLLTLHNTTTISNSSSSGKEVKGEREEEGQAERGALSNRGGTSRSTPNGHPARGELDPIQRSLRKHGALGVGCMVGSCPLPMTWLLSCRIITVLERADLQLGGLSCRRYRSVSCCTVPSFSSCIFTPRSLSRSSSLPPLYHPPPPLLSPLVIPASPLSSSSPPPLLSQILR